MALNKFMHPKNPYRTPPDFKQLAIKYPEFRKHVQQDLSGKVHLDFKDEGSVKALTNALLDKDFSLMVELPDDRLVPTLPLRLNYLLWIEDLLIFCGLADKKVMGIDIGTGASCIYPLLAARKFDWSMLATEIDKQSVRVAQSNVNRNSLSDKIKVEHVDVGSILVGVVDEGKVYDFSMCNPPFFSDRCEVGRGNNAPSGLEHELVAQGGEIAFITKIIADSAQLGQSVRLYTTMIGHKSHVSSVKREVRAAGARSMVSTELCQGRTIRWVVAWTFMPDIDLSSMDKTCGLPKNQPHDKRPPLIYNFTLAQPSSLDAIKNKVQDALTKLEMAIMMTSVENNSVGMTIIGYKNTWSHQRRKRRQVKNQPSTSDCHIESLECINEPQFITNKRRKEGQQYGNCDPATKKARLEKVACDIDVSYEVSSPLLVAILIITEMSTDQFRFELTFVEGSGGREATNQVLQYLKNNIK